MTDTDRRDSADDCIGFRDYCDCADCVEAEDQARDEEDSHDE